MLSLDRIAAALAGPKADRERMPLPLSVGVSTFFQVLPSNSRSLRLSLFSLLQISVDPEFTNPLKMPREHYWLFPFKADAQ